MNYLPGKRLVLLRNALNIGQSELAKKVGISQPYLSEIESGKKQSESSDLWRALAKALDSTPAWLREGTGWAYLPPSIEAAVQFALGQIESMLIDRVFIISYLNFMLLRSVGFLFLRRDGMISMEGTQLTINFNSENEFAYFQIFEKMDERKVRSLLVHTDIPEDVLFRIDIPDTFLVDGKLDLRRAAKELKKQSSAELSNLGKISESAKKIFDRLKTDFTQERTGPSIKIDPEVIKKAKVQELATTLDFWDIQEVGDYEIILLKMLRRNNVNIPELIRRLKNGDI